MIKLDTDLFFSMEKSDKNVRLIVHSGESELVCRKTKPSEIKKLLQTAGTNLFKGRLQLLRAGTDIVVQVKGDLAGTVSVDDFSRYYNEATGF